MSSDHTFSNDTQEQDKRVLLAVDDKQDNLFVLQKLIANKLPHCEIITTTSPQEGIEIASSRSVDGLLIDVQMPGMDGIEMCRQLKLRQSTANIPIILITAYEASPRLRAEGLDAGADDFLAKPIDNLELVAKVRVMLRIRRAENELRQINEHLEQMVEERTNALLESEERLRFVLSGACLGWWDWDLVNNRISRSQSWADMLGYTLGEVQQPNLSKQIMHPEDVRRVEALEEEHISGGTQFFEHEARYRTKSGQYLWALARGRVTERGEDGRAVRISGILQNISERKQLEEERTRAAQLESIGVLAGGIAHDFNNILSVILGNISLANMAVKKEKYKVTKFLTDAETACWRARDLTLQLLTFSKGGIPVKRTVTLKGLIRETSGFALRGSNVRCTYSIARDLWPCDVDEGQISQVLNNLLINADQAMPEGGTINLSAENVTLQAQDKLPLKEGRYVKLTVADQGCGIPYKDLSKIFDPYFTTKEKGSGLGLTTTYSIINRHGGYLKVESELKVGTSFHIYLPAARKQTEEKKEKKKEIQFTGGRILVMDDEKALCDVVSNMLEKIGLEVECTNNGTKVINMYKKAKDSGQPYFAVILDLTIPGGMGGKETMEQLSKIDPDVKAIVSSGYSNDPVMADFRKYGFKGVASKPYRIEELRLALHSMMH